MDVFGRTIGSSWVKDLSRLALTLMAIGPSLVIASDPDLSREAINRITISELKRHCETLASDALEGREAGARGGQAAAAYLQTELRKIPGISPATNSGWVQEFDPNYRNVLAVLPGSDPDLRHEVILIGAHYDHVGRGNQNNSQGPIGYIHNGADDNASGTAALLELIDAFASLKRPPRRTILFAFWDAEEIGLFGSKHWVSRPTHPLKDLRLVVNIDMLGRLREGKVIVVGWRSAPGLRPRLARHNRAGDLHFHYEPTVIGDSDHHPFYMAGIPILHLDSGKHDDYHRPTDDADKLNYAGIRQIAGLVFELVHESANEDKLPSFRREALTERPPAWLSASPQATNSPRLGVTFDPRQFTADQAVLATVNAGSAAANGGLVPGDQLIRFGHWNRGTVADLLTIIQVAQNPVTVHVERAGAAAPVELQVTLSRDPVRVGIGWTADNAIPDSLIITRIIADAPAARAGLKVGDVIWRVSGAPVTSEDDFRRHLQKDPSPIPFQIERNGRFLDIEVPLFEPPASTAADPV